jgi:type II secretory pathway pseudopilin PulG
MQSHAFKAREAGFGLIETLIAMAIVTVMIALVFESISANASATNAMIDRRRAALVAKSALDVATIGRDAPLQGVAGTMRWRVAVEPYQDAAGRGPRLELITVTVSKASGAKPLLQLRTLRVGR